jgi:hypothetical protein
MSSPAKVINPAGRVDLLAQNLLKQGISAHGNTVLKVCYKAFETELADAFTACLGPGTQADQIGKTVRELNDRLAKAFQQVREEERNR